MQSKLSKLLKLLNIVSVFALFSIILYGFLFVYPAEDSKEICSENTFYNYVGFVLFPCIIYLSIYRLFLRSSSKTRTQECSEKIKIDKEKKEKRLTVWAIIALIIGLLLYYYIDITNPTIRRWQKETNVLVISYQQHGINAGGPYDKKIIISDKKEIDEWLDLIVTKTRYEFLKLPCNCSGNPWLKLYENDRPIAEISIHMGSGIRCEKLGMGVFSLSRENSLALAKKCAEIGIEYYLKHFPGVKKEILQNRGSVPRNFFLKSKPILIQDNNMRDER